MRLHDKKECDICQEEFSSRHFKSHRIKCIAREEPPQLHACSFWLYDKKPAKVAKAYPSSQT